MINSDNQDKESVEGFLTEADAVSQAQDTPDTVESADESDPEPSRIDKPSHKQHPGGVENIDTPSDGAVKGDSEVAASAERDAEFDRLDQENIQLRAALEETQEDLANVLASLEAPPGHARVAMLVRVTPALHPAYRGERGAVELNRVLAREYWERRLRCARENRSWGDPDVQLVEFALYAHDLTEQPDPIESVGQSPTPMPLGSTEPLPEPPTPAIALAQGRRTPASPAELAVLKEKVMAAEQEYAIAQSDYEGGAISRRELQQYHHALVAARRALREGRRPPRPVPPPRPRPARPPWPCSR